MTATYWMLVNIRKESFCDCAGTFIVVKFFTFWQKLISNIYIYIYNVHSAYMQIKKKYVFWCHLLFSPTLWNDPYTMYFSDARIIGNLSYRYICLLCSVFSKRRLVYAAGTNTDVCARNYLYPVFLLTKTQPRGFYQWIFIKDTPLPDWQDDKAQELGHAACWVHL